MIERAAILGDGKRPGGRDGARRPAGREPAPSRRPEAVDATGGPSRRSIAAMARHIEARARARRAAASRARAARPRSSASTRTRCARACGSSASTGLVIAEIPVDPVPLAADTFRCPPHPPDSTVRSIVPLAVVAVSLALTSPSGAVSVGRFGGAQGCGCHGLEPAPSTTVTVESDGPVAPGSEATLTVRITETAIPAHPDHQQGGFNLVVGEGSLASLDADAVRAEGREAGHRRLGNRQREWRVAWRVPDLPSACTLEVQAAALAANGDSSTTYDEWNRTVIGVPVAAGDDHEVPDLAFVKPPSPALTIGALDLSVPAPLDDPSRRAGRDRHPRGGSIRNRPSRAPRHRRRRHRATRSAGVRSGNGALLAALGHARRAAGPASPDRRSL